MYYVLIICNVKRSTITINAFCKILIGDYINCIQFGIIRRILRKRQFRNSHDDAFGKNIISGLNDNFNKLPK